MCGAGFQGSERMSGWLSSSKRTSSVEVRGRHFIIMESFAPFSEGSTMVCEGKDSVGLYWESTYETASLRNRRVACDKNVDECLKVSIVYSQIKIQNVNGFHSHIERH
jgi:hypothetical protein